MSQKKASAYARERKEQRFRIIAGVAIIIIVATASILAYILLQPPALTIRIEPSSIGKLAVGSTFTVNVIVENAVNVSGMQLDIRYNPDVLNATDASEGPFFPSSTGQITVFRCNPRQDLNATPPVWRVICFDVVANHNVSGNGTLLSITFMVLSDGSSSIELYPYPGGGVTVGSYLDRASASLTGTATEFIPVLHSGSYA